jgi:hypothetical protein
MDLLPSVRVLAAVALDRLRSGVRDEDSDA